MSGSDAASRANLGTDVPGSNVRQVCQPDRHGRGTSNRSFGCLSRCSGSSQLATISPRRTLRSSFPTTRPLATVGFRIPRRAGRHQAHRSLRQPTLSARTMSWWQSGTRRASSASCQVSCRQATFTTKIGVYLSVYKESALQPRQAAVVMTWSATRPVPLSPASAAAALAGSAWPPPSARAAAAAGLGSLVFGAAFDRAGLGILAPLTIASARLPRRQVARARRGRRLGHRDGRARVDHLRRGRDDGRPEAARVHLRHLHRRLRLLVVSRQRPARPALRRVAAGGRGGRHRARAVRGAVLRRRRPSFESARKERSLPAARADARNPSSTLETIGIVARASSPVKAQSNRWHGRSPSAHGLWTPVPRSRATWRRESARRASLSRLSTSG